MKDWRILTGIALGLAVAIWFVPRGGPPDATGGELLSDADGEVREFVIQYTSGAASIADAAYREFLRHLPAERTVYVLCPKNDDFIELVATVGPVRCRMEPVTCGHPITCWSRDRWLALADLEGRVTLLTSTEETGEQVWPHRAGDRLAGRDLAESLERVNHVRGKLGFDGGDFVADDETVFITPRVARRNGAVTAEGRDTLEETFAAILDKKAVLLEVAPPYHAGMFMMLVGNRTALVAEPVQGPIPGSELCDTAPFDAVADRLEEEGYRVVRIQVVPGSDGRTWMTFVNVVIDREGDDRIVYMPVYRQVPELNDAAEEVWRSVGFEVRRVDCSETYTSFGSLRCLVSVLRRD